MTESHDPTRCRRCQNPLLDYVPLQGTTGAQERAKIRECLIGLNVDAPNFEEQLLDRVADAIAQAVQAALDEIDEIVAKWEEAYPEDVFRPFVAADHPHVSPDRIGAQMGRHMARELRKQIAALRARPTPSEATEPTGEKG